MRARDIIAAIVGDSGKSGYQLSHEMGMSHGYISQKVAAGSPPNTETIAAICAATGHEVVIRNRKTGHEIIIDPPER